MHHIHETRGFVIDSVPAGQADRLLYLFTRELGLVPAIAKSVREVRSKLRPHLELYDESKLSLVRGKAVWRVTGAETEALWFLTLKEAGKLELYARASSLLRRFLAGEEPHPELYDVFSSGIRFLASMAPRPPQLKAFEALLVFRILYLLGYVGDEKLIAEFCRDSHLWTPDLIAAAESREKDLVALINRALRESHL